MFDLNDDTLTRVKRDHPVDRLQIDAPAEPDEPGHPLDNEHHARLHTRLMAYYRQELERQGANRFQQATDEDYYDNDQWSEEDKQVLRERGQAPIVYNVIATSVDWVLGSEKRGRTDFKILPRGKEDAKQAEGKTKLMKYLSDVNKTSFHRSRAFEDTVKVGVGWLEESVQDSDDGEPIYCRYENWRNMLWDSAATELDGSDMRYLFRSKWVDEDVAQAMFPERADVIANSVSTSTTFGLGVQQDGDLAMDAAEEMLDDAGGLGAVHTHKRRRVRLIEAWYRAPQQVRRMKGGPFDGEEIDPENVAHAHAIQQGLAKVTTRTQMRVRVAILTPSALLFDGPSPFKHNRFKFVPIWGFRRGKDNLPYGLIRRVRDIQDDINKRASKALAILSSNKVIMDEGALPDGTTLDEFADEVADPNGIIVKRPGKSIDLNVDRDLAPSHLEFMSRNIQMVQQAGGVTDENMGRQTNAVSGIAIERRQEQGSLATAKFFDNLRLAEQLRGELELSLVEQFMTEQKQFRITNQRGTPEFVTVNDGLPENDITRTKADFVVSESEWRATMRQAATAELTDMLAKMPPQVALVVLDLLVEEMDIGNREEIVKRIRAVTGQRDPDATEPTPEEMQAAEMQAKQAAAQEALLNAELLEKQGKARKANADATRAERGAIADSMSAAKSAMEAATSLVQTPTVAKVADHLLKDAGWAGAHAAPAVPAVPAVQAEPAVPAEPAGPMAPPDPMMQDPTNPEPQGAMQ